MTSSKWSACGVVFSESGQKFVLNERDGSNIRRLHRCSLTTLKLIENQESRERFIRGFHYGNFELFYRNNLDS